MNPNPTQLPSVMKLTPIPFATPIALKIDAKLYESADYDTLIFFTSVYIKESCTVLNLTSNIVHMAQKLAIYFLQE